MVPVLNKIFLQGRMVRDPELRHTQSGTAVASFTLAVDRDFKGKDGNRETDFIDCVAWRSTAEFASRFFGRGRMAVVTGSLQLRDWTDKEGNKRRSAEVLVDSMYFADSKRDSDPLDKLAEDAAPVSEPSFQEMENDPSELPF